MHTIFEELGGTYHEENGYLIPNLEPPETPQLGLWGRRYLHHLKTAKSSLYTELFFSGKLTEHLEETDRRAEEMMDRLVTQRTAAEGTTEQLKAENQTEWVRRMNNIRSRVEEIIWSELTT